MCIVVIKMACLSRVGYYAVSNRAVERWQARANGKSRSHFKLITRRHVHSLEMQLGTDSFDVVILAVTLEHVNPKSVGFDKVTRTIIMIIPIGGFRFIVLTFPHNHTNTHTHTHTSRQR